MRAILFLAIDFSAFWTNQATSAEQPPITILSAWIAPSPHASVLTVVNAEPGIPMHIVESDKFGEHMLFVKIRANRKFNGLSFDIQSFSASGKDLTRTPDDGQSWSTARVVEKGETVTCETSLNEKKNIFSVKCRVWQVMTVDASNTTLTAWTPPADHPITFEARFKPEDKAKKNSNGGK